jgi:rRNA small subunit pseudouridine methyltransferase Nep1
VTLTVLLADAEIEPLPSGSIRNVHRTPILDSYVHGDIVRSLPQGERRGRADIAHAALALCQGSRYNQQGKMRILLHTRGDKVIRIDPRARVPPNYLEFLDLMADLFTGAHVPGYHLSSGDVSTLVSGLNPDPVIVLSPQGEEADLTTLMEQFLPRGVVTIIGAFPIGDYASPVYALADRVISLGNDLLTVPTVVSELLSAVYLVDHQR